MHKVSIIIPTYNHADFLEQRLASVFGQTYQNFEVILLDDCSTDNSNEILKAYQNHPQVSHLIFNKTNSGSPFKQWQKGIALAKGKYVWIAESDDFCSLNFLEEIFKNLNDETGLIYSQSQDVDEKEVKIYDRIQYTEEFEPNIWESDFDLNGHDFVKQYLCFKNVIPNASAVVFKRDLVDDSLFSKELLDMKMCGDWLFWIKLVSDTNIQFIHQHLNFFRQHIKTTRQHHTIEIKKQRLLEETKIRNFVFENFSFKDDKKDRLLYQKWFKLFKKNQIFQKDFKAIKMDQNSWFEFYTMYFQQKISK